jgi:hypothetical protein
MLTMTYGSGSKQKKGLDQLDRGEFLTHDQMGARIELMFRS